MNAPTLIVGLGGKGSDIVLRVSKMVNERVDAEQRQKIGFAVFDTDVNELRQIGIENPHVRTIQTSTKLSVGEYLDIDTHSRDTWFPVNAILNSKTLTEGAGQVRAISRLAFETAVRAGKLEPLHKAIEDLYKLEGSQYQQALRVIIVSSLAGGTGSGLILPVALYIKNYLATHFRQSANITRGFFLLPEIFYEVIPGHAERNNLKCNAYATLRELDAFLMKSDSSLEDRYEESVKIEFPNVSSNEYEEFKVRPFDFCFLFDAQNADGKKMNSFEEYLSHAASCIYAMSIGPMNKRSNSSEDNTIRKLCAEKGRNRYAGAGTSMLIYPTEEVKEYLALNWAKQCISDQWMVFDREFKKRKADIAKMRQEGARVRDIDANRNYIDTVNEKVNINDGFATAISDACGVFDEDGIEKLSTTWETYLDTLITKIRTDNSEGNVVLDEAKKAAKSRIAALSDREQMDSKDVWEPYVNAYEDIVRYKSLTVRNVNELSYTVAYTIFKSENNAVLQEKLPHQMETFMRNQNQEFIHPNAVRYYLYNLLENMQKQLQITKKAVKDQKEYFEKFEVLAFDDPSTEEEVEKIDDLAKTKKVSVIDKVRRRTSADQEELISHYNRYMEHINNHRVDAILEAVLEEGITYVNNLCKAFESFYLSFDDKIAEIDKRILALEKRFNVSKGSATRYVCASSRCLKKMAEEMPYIGSFINIDGKLAEDIYTRVRNYALMTSKPENGEYFKEIFQDGILGYFKSALMSSYGASIDMNIIDAIEKEATYERGIESDEDKELYITSVFDESKILAAPFIEKALGEERDPINSCTYSNKLDPGDDSPRSKLIKRELKNFGGTPDADIPLNTILFYKSFYGLRATDLSKFAPPQTSETFSRNGGEYFKAYYELVEQIHPRTDLSKVITPHIDRWWHNVSKMPDLDDDNQKRQENNIYRALFWGFMGNYIELAHVGQEEMIYRLKVDDLDMDGELNTLVVSNGTPCDKLYETLDALSIFPELVAQINRKVDYLCRNDMEDCYDIGSTKLCKWLNSFRVKEYPLPDGGIRSVFDLPLLIRRNQPTELYYEERLIKILRVELNEIVEYITKVDSSKDAITEVGRVILEQFDRFIAGIEQEKECYRNIYHEALFDRFTTIIKKKLEELGLRKEAAFIEDRVNELKHG